MSEITLQSLDADALRRRLDALHERQPPADPATPPLRIGIADADGELLHVVETARFLEAVQVFEVLGEYGLEPREGRHRTRDGRRLTRLYAPGR